MPAASICKVAQFLGVMSVTSMVMCDDSQTACCGQTGESLISIVMFAQSVKNLQNADWLAGRQPKRSPNAMLIRCGKLKRLSLNVGHSDTQ